MTRISLGGGLLAAGAALAYCGAAQAQETGGSSKRFTVAAHATAEYDSNLAGGDNQVAAIRNVTPEDVTYTAGVSAGFQLPSSRETFFINGSADFNRHQRNHNLDSQNLALAGGASAHAGPCVAGVVGSFSRAETAPVELLIAVTKNIAQNTTGTLSVTCTAGHFVTSVSATGAKTTNDAPGLIDTSQRSIAASAGYGTETLGALSVTTHYSESSFSQPPIPGQPSPSPPKQYGVGLSYARKIGLRLSGTAAVSFVQIDSAGQSSHGVDANVALAYRISQRTGLSLTYARGVAASQTIDAILQRTETLDLNGNYNLNRRISLHATIEGGRTNFEGGIPSPLLVRENRYLSETAGASLAIGRNIAVTLEAGHSSRTADLTQFNFSSNHVTLGISSTF